MASDFAAVVIYGFRSMKSWFIWTYWVAGLLGANPLFADDVIPIERAHWLVAQTGHFNIYSCGEAQAVFKVAAQLEQFREVYGLLAGAQAVQNPPITVMAFPNHAEMLPFLPLYEGKPANLSGFFKRSAEENIIVLELDETGSLSTIFHEYSHLLFRRNDPWWPLWLKEGMAEIYSTWNAEGRTVTIARPIPHHLRLLAHEQMMPLAELLKVSHDSPQYNEGVQQGIFYAESWLLTHFLMNGDNAAFKAGFPRYTALLRQGESASQALTNALHAPLPRIEAELRRYLAAGQFEAISRVVGMDFTVPRRVATRVVGPAEACYHLGDELLRINRFDSAKEYFDKAAKLAPRSSLAYEGYGLLAAEQEKSKEAVAQLEIARERHSINFLAYYVCAREQLHLTADDQGRYVRVTNELAEELRGELQKSIALMPDFGPSQELGGFFELVQGENYPLAENYLRRAIQLEPENEYYLIYLAEAQMRQKNRDDARQTLEVILQGNAGAKLKARAQTLVEEINELSAQRRTR